MTSPARELPPSDPGARPRPAAQPAVDAVPRLPRGRGMRFSRFELFRIAGLTILLVFLLATQRPCANAVSSFVTGFGDGGSAAATLPRPGTVDLPATGGAGSATPGAAPGSAGDDLDRYEQLRPGMTEAEIKAAIARARARAGSASGQGDPARAPANATSSPAR